MEKHKITSGKNDGACEVDVERTYNMIKNQALFFVLLYLLLTFFSLSIYSGGTAKENLEHKSQSKIGIASWYGKRFHGKKTASGKNFDMYNQTAAHRSLPLGTRVRVVNLKNGKDTIVDINDRGPYIKGRMIDLSYAAAKSIGIVNDGIAKVKLEVLSMPSGNT